MIRKWNVGARLGHQMLTDFEDLLSIWRGLAADGGIDGLPTRQQLTASSFSRFMPTMLIARWDTKSWIPEIDYCGTRLDELLKRDVVQEPVKAVFQPGPHLETHLEVAKTVIQEQVGAELKAEVALGGGNSIVASQLRLPLAPICGKPVILSVFEIPPFEAHQAIEGQVVLSNLKYTYIPL